MWGLIKSSISKECTPPCYRIKESRNSVFRSDLNWICLFFIKVWKMDASHLIYLRCCSPFYSSRCIPLGRHRVLFFFFQKIIYQLEGKRDERQEISFAFIAAKWTFTAELLWVFFFSSLKIVTLASWQFHKVRFLLQSQANQLYLKGHIWSASF